MCNAKAGGAYQQQEHEHFYAPVVSAGGLWLADRVTAEVFVHAVLFLDLHIIL